MNIFIVISIVLLIIVLIFFIFKRIKVLLHAFKRGYNNALPLTQNMILLKNIEQLKDIEFLYDEKKIFAKKQKGSTYLSIRQEWKEIIYQNQKEIKNLYEQGIIDDWVECRTKMENNFTFEDEIYSLLCNWLERIDWSNTDDVKVLFKYIELVSNDDYTLNGLVLLKYHKRILKSIDMLILKEDFKIIDRLHHGNLGELISQLINLYFFHTKYNYNQGHCAQYDIDRKEMAKLIPDFIKAFPADYSNLTISILEKNTENLIETCANLLHFFIVNKIDHHSSFTSKLFDMYQKPSDPIYDNSQSILKKTFQISSLDDVEIKFFIEKILLNHLKLNSLENQEREIQNHIDNLEKNNFEEKIIHKYKKLYSELSTNFESNYTKSWNKSVQRLAIAKSLFESLTLIVVTFTKYPNIQVLRKLLEETKTYKNKSKLYDFTKKPQIVFKDLHFKYLVIEELMYNQQILLPGFDVKILASEYNIREIDVEYEGYEIIPEVKKYFENLDIPVDLLEKVTTLYQDSGFGGGSEFIYQLQPFWDPGCGDEVFRISNKAIDDLVFLPNLKMIIGLENSEPSAKLIKAIQNKGIVLEDEDTY